MQKNVELKKLRLEKNNNFRSVLELAGTAIQERAKHFYNHGVQLADIQAYKKTPKAKTLTILTGEIDYQAIKLAHEWAKNGTGNDLEFSRDPDTGKITTGKGDKVLKDLDRAKELSVVNVSIVDKPSNIDIIRTQIKRSESTKKLTMVQRYYAIVACRESGNFDTDKKIADYLCVTPQTISEVGRYDLLSDAELKKFEQSILRHEISSLPREILERNGAIFDDDGKLAMLTKKDIRDLCNYRIAVRDEKTKLSFNEWKATIEAEKQAKIDEKQESIMTLDKAIAWIVDVLDILASSQKIDDMPGNIVKKFNIADTTKYDGYGTPENHAAAIIAAHERSAKARAKRAAVAARKRVKDPNDSLEIYADSGNSRKTLKPDAKTRAKAKAAKNAAKSKAVKYAKAQRESANKAIAVSRNGKKNK